MNKQNDVLELYFLLFPLTGLSKNAVIFKIQSLGQEYYLGRNVNTILYLNSLGYNVLKFRGFFFVVSFEKQCIHIPYIL